MKILTNKQKEKIAKGEIEIKELQELIPNSNWKIISHLGNGGTGVAYNVLNLIDGRNAVLKINSRFGNGKNDKDRQQRFELEIDILNKLKSKIKNNNLCVVEILDNYKDNPNKIENFQWYVVEKGEKIEKHLLDKIIKSSSPYDFLKYIVESFIDLFKTLDYLHANKIAHRDIKPDNLIFDTVNQKFLFIDFGIAKTNNSAAFQLTENNEKDRYSLGPKITMPPEMENNPANADPYKADVYSLTKTMYLFIKCYKKLDYCFKGQFNLENHHYKNTLIERYNNLLNSNIQELLTFFEDKELAEFMYSNTYDDPKKRMTAKESWKNLEKFIAFITPIDWGSTKDAAYAKISDYKHELNTYIIDFAGGKVKNLEMTKYDFRIEDYTFLKFLNKSFITKKIKNNLEVNDISIKYEYNHSLFFDNNKINSINIQIQMYYDKYDDEYYFIKIILNSRKHTYIYEYDSCFMFI